MNNNDCVFCKIVKGELPCYKIWEDDDFLAFLSINPPVEGLTVLIPKKHYPSYFKEVENKMNKIYYFLKYLTNNRKIPKHETEWDIAFIIIMTLALIYGSVLLIIKGMGEWTAFLLIEYIWAFDNLRYNRP